MLLLNKQIAIIGGGPGGLTLARLLQLKGANVKVYERDLNKDARIAGSPLDMHEGSGMAAISEAGLMKELKNNFSPGADKKVITDEKAKILFSDHDTGLNEDIENGSFNPEIDRVRLRKIFLDSLQPATVNWDSHFMSMETQNGGWLLHFKNGTSAHADLVIAADGANSKIRPYITNTKSFYVGITMVEFNVPNAKKSAPNIYKLLQGGKIMAFAYQKCILGGQKGNGELGFYASFKPGENWATESGIDFTNKAQLLQWFKNEYTDWSDIWYEVIENTTHPVIPRPIYCMPLNQTWNTKPNVTMLGDAAHVMPPFAGEGANMAMLDALILSECLTSGKYHTLYDAISSYEAGMCKRASAAAKRSLENGERMHSENALAKMLAVFAQR
ncbi:MAG: FAD-dependent monooxygenase [Bacteroidota bacterium]